MNIRPYRHPDDEITVVALWEQCGLIRTANDPRMDIQRKLRVNPEMFLVGELDGKIVATVMAGYEGRRGWINYLAVDSEHRHSGLARAIMTAAERVLRGVGCPKINLQVRSSNKDVIGFYQRIGFRVDDVVSMGKRLEQEQ